MRISTYGIERIQVVYIQRLHQGCPKHCHRLSPKHHRCRFQHGPQMTKCHWAGEDHHPHTSLHKQDKLFASMLYKVDTSSVFHIAGIPIFYKLPLIELLFMKSEIAHTLLLWDYPQSIVELANCKLYVYVLCFPDNRHNYAGTHTLYHDFPP